MLGLFGVSGDLDFAFHNTHNHNILTHAHATPTYTNQDGDEFTMKLKQARMCKQEEGAETWTRRREKSWKEEGLGKLGWWMRVSLFGHIISLFPCFEFIFFY